MASRLAKQYPSVDVDPELDLVMRESRIVEPVAPGVEPKRLFTCESIRY